MTFVLHFDGRDTYTGTDLAEVLARAGQSAPPPPAPLPFPTAAPIPLCVLFVDADRVPGNLAPDTRRDWRYCPKGHGENGMVCLCRNCGPRCPDYQADVPPA